MGKYVDLSQTVTASYYDEEHEEWRFKQRTIEDLLDDLCDSYTTTDAVPVRHGKWMLGVSLWYCSECGSSYSYGDYAFCPNCGADMRKDGDPNE